MLTNAFLIIFGCALLPTIVYPHVGVLVWAWFAYMSPNFLVWSPLDIEFQDIIVVFIVTGVCASMLFSRWGAVGLVTSQLTRRPVIILLGFVAWMAVTTQFAAAPTSAAVKWDAILKSFALPLATLVLITSRERVHSLVWIIAIAVGFFGIKGGVFTILTGGNHLVFGAEGTRFAANNSFGLAMTMVIPLMFYLAQESESKLVRLSIGAAALLSFISVLGTFSRGSILAAFATLFFLLIRSRRRALSFLAVLLVAGTSLTVMSVEWKERMQIVHVLISGADESDLDESSRIRLVMWRFARNVAIDRPFLGGGFDFQDSEELQDRFGLKEDGGVIVRGNRVEARSIHSVYFEVLGEQGFVGLGLFVLFFGSGIFVTERIISVARSSGELHWAGTLARMLQASFVGFGVGGLFLNKAYIDLFYQLVIISVIVDGLISKERQAEENRGQLIPLYLRQREARK